jgi:hypothetical protein
MLSASIAQQLRFEQELRRREAELQMVLQTRTMLTYALITTV